MNIFIRELKANRKALIIWSACMFLLVISGLSKFTAYSAGGVDNDIFAKMPRTMRVLLGIGSFEVTKMSGFYAFLYPFIELTAAIHAALLGSGILAKEERDKTTEFIIVKPVSRFTIVTAKLMAAFVNIVILNIVSMLSSILMIPAFNHGNNIIGEIFTFHMSLLLVQLIFLSLGALAAAFLKKPKASGSITIEILMAAYVISKITDLTENLDVLNIFSPFKYFSLTRIVNGDGLSSFIVILSLVLIALCSSFTYFFYLRRDLNI